MCLASVNYSSHYRCSQFGDVLSRSDMSLYRKLQRDDCGNSLFWDSFTNTGVCKKLYCCGWERDKTVVSNGFYFLNDNSVFLPFWWLEKLLFLQTAHSMNEKHICFMEQTISFLIQQRGLIIEGTVLIMLLKWRFWAKAIWVKVL